MTAINGSDTIIGYSSTGGSPLRWNPDGTVTALGQLPGGATSAADYIDPAGTIAGTSLNAAGHQRAVVWRRGG